MALFFDISNWKQVVSKHLTTEEFVQIETLFQSATELDVPAKTTLLDEGEVATKVFLIKQGSLRLWLNDKGREITVQFFFEGGVVSSFESVIKQEPSRFSIETIEPCKLAILDICHIKELLAKIPKIQEFFTLLATERLIAYRDMFISRITLSPQERYEELLKLYPKIFLRIPQHLIASYLGITSVSLSRIRSRHK